jgi:3-hydroxyisobutyrate dehydrogenase
LKGEAMSASVAVLGLGIMGAGMAENLIAKGFAVTVYNRSPAKAAAFKDKARIATTPAGAASGADFVIAMLSDDAASRGVWLEGGALAAARPGAILIESSTISQDWVRELAGKAAAARLGFVDAPVTGSKQQASQGSLRFFAGGAPEHIEKARGVFAAMGSAVIHLGPAGSGVTMKLINNFLAGVQVASLAEGLVMAEKCGLDSAQVLGLLLEGAPASPLLKTVGGRIAARDYAPNFFAALMAKDLDYATRQAASVGITLDSAAAARARFVDAVRAGLGEMDIAAVIEPLRK